MNFTAAYALQAALFGRRRRGWPTLKEVHARAFRHDAPANANNHEFTLVTTWDLYRFALAVITNHWTGPDIKEFSSSPEAD